MRGSIALNNSAPMIVRSLPVARFTRHFGSTTRLCKDYSIIGREPIKIPAAVTITPSPAAVNIAGPLGVTSVPLKNYMKVDFANPSTLKLTVQDGSEKLQRQMWGTTRTLISNAITGMTDGFSVPLYLVGVSYRVALEEDHRGTTDGGNGKRLNLKLGYSHPIFVPIPSYIKAEVPSPTKIVLFCTDKHLLGLFAAKIREYRKPEPYKGKVSNHAFPMVLPVGLIVCVGRFCWKRNNTHQEYEKEIETFGCPFMFPVFKLVVWMGIDILRP